MMLPITSCFIVYSFVILAHDVLFADASAPTSYTPNGNVVAAHNIPHLTKTLQQTNNDFLGVASNGTLSGPGVIAYIESTIVLPAILVILGVLSVIILQIVMCCRWCCKRWCFKTFQSCCKCVRTHNEGDELAEGGVVATTTKVGLGGVGISFFIFLVLVVVADLTALAGLRNFMNSFAAFSSALVSLGNIFQNIYDGSSEMQTAGNRITTTLSSNMCRNVSPAFLGSFKSGVNSFSVAAGDVASLTSGLPHFFTRINKQLSYYGSDLSSIVYIYLSVIVFNVLLFVGAAFSRSKMFFSVPFLLSELIVLTLTIISGIEMVVVVSPHLQSISRSR